MHGATYGRTDVVRVLIKAGADIDAKDGEGKTALNYAKKNGKCYQLLKEAGAK
jgi:ankyrin repeat protein